MAGLGFPRAWFAELIVNGGWQRLETAGVSDIRQTDPITITRGRGDEQRQMPPSKLTEVLDNTDGKYTQGNVFSALYGHLGENTPVRQGLLIADDSFGRTVAGGWGTASTGETWTTAGTFNTAAVGSGVGTHSISAVNASGLSYANVEVKDSYVKFDYIPSISNVTGGELAIGPTFRRNAGGDYYFARVVITTSETYELQVWRWNGAWTGLSESSPAVAGLTHTAGQAVSIAAAIEGRVIVMKAWLATDPEPYEWQQVAWDPDDENALDEPGFWGIRSEISAANSNALPLSFGFDNVDVRFLRASGELTSLPPWWDETHNIKVSSLNVSDVWQRLRRSNALLRSAMRRAIDTDANRPLNYWPCEDLADSDSIASGVDGGPPMVVTGATPDYAQHTGFACSAPLLYLNQAQLVGSIPTYTHTGDLMHRFLMFIPDSGSVDGAILYRVQCANGGVWRWEIKYHAANTMSVQAYDFSNLTIFDSGALALGVNGKLLRVQLALEQDGADIDWSLAILEVGATTGGVGSGTTAGRTLGTVDNVVFNPNLLHDQVAIGHVTVYNVVTTLFDFYESLQAYAGETSGRRFLRNCDENGITGAVWGDPDEGAPMGPQRPGSLSDIYDLIAATEQGPIFSARSFNGLILRMRHTLYAQQPALTLDYSAHEVAPSLTPAPDDFNLRNDITVKRVDGSSFQSTLESGPKNAGRPWEDPEAVGPMPDQVNVSTQADSQLRDIADTELRIGTAPETRYPQITVNLAAGEITTALLLAVLGVNVGDRVVVTDLQEADIYESIDQLVQGYTELSPNQTLHSVVFNATPYSPYATIVLDEDYVDGDVEVAEVVDTSETGIDITADVLLSTTAGDYPQGCRIGGEEMTVTAVAGASFPQTMTVTRGVNTGGVGLAHSIGDVVTFIPAGYAAR